MSNAIIIPPNGVVEFTILSCGPLGKHQFRFHLQKEYVQVQTVKTFYPDECPTGFAQDQAKGIYDINAEQYARAVPGAPLNWVPCVNKHIKIVTPGSLWNYIWGYEAEGLNGYLSLQIELL